MKTVKVMKFGGTSVANAERLLAVARLVKQETVCGRVGLVLSAMSGVTNQLLESITEVLDGASESRPYGAFAELHRTTLEQLTELCPAMVSQPPEGLEAVIAEYRDLLKGIRLLDECPASVSDRISSLGERALVPLAASLLRALGLTVMVLDPRQVIVTDSVFGNASPILAEIEQRLEAARTSDWDVLLLPGFFGSDRKGRFTTLGRGGSDYSAAILAAALPTEELEIWTDVDGVYSADPRVVTDAFVLNELNFAEAMELSFFGAKVLHPRAISPVIERGIPVRIRNTFHPDNPGTLLTPKVEAGPRPVRGLSTLENVAMLGVSGAGLRGVPGTAARVFGAMAKSGISVILIAQASSEYSICFCVPQASAEAAATALEQEFSVERRAGLVDAIETVHDLAVISVVGESMRFHRGLAGTFFGGLAAADVNVVAIAQGFSERNMSAVIAGVDRDRALRATHQHFFNTRQNIQVVLMGVGTVGSELLRQISSQQKTLRRQGVDLRLIGVANSRNMALDFGGIDPVTATTLLDTGNQTDLPTITKLIAEARLLNPVFVDVTGNEKIALNYPTILEAGMHVVTANKIANSATWSYYQQVRHTANRRQRRFLYETNVGAGLPVIDTLHNLRNSGDRLQCCQGLLSGSLSFIFGCLDDGMLFSEAVRAAHAKGFTEPDPRDDLSGLDVARKVLILAREWGMPVELADIRRESPLPADFAANDDVPTFLERCAELDAPIATHIESLREKGQVWRFLGRIENGICTVGPVAVSECDPLAFVRDGENAVSFLTDRYAPIPLLVRGYGAGPAVTAAGVFADILRTVSWNEEEATEEQ